MAAAWTIIVGGKPAGDYPDYKQAHDAWRRLPHGPEHPPSYIRNHIAKETP